LERVRVMTLYENENEIKYLKNLIKNKLKHTYLDQYIQRPIIEDEKLIFLNEILNHLPTYKKESYIVTIMLIDIALTIHDSVNDGPELPEHMPERVSKQLSVLAGDYYSGLYYLLLSEIDDFKMIHTLADAIKVINEQKMKLYYQEFSSFDEFMECVKDINSLSISYVASHINEPILSEFVSDWLLLDKLYSLKENVESNQSHFLENWLGESPYYSNQDLDVFLKRDIPISIKNIEKSAKQIPDSYVKLKSYIFNKIDHMKIDMVIIQRTEEG